MSLSNSQELRFDGVGVRVYVADDCMSVLVFRNWTEILIMGFFFAFILTLALALTIFAGYFDFVYRVTDGGVLGHILCVCSLSCGSWVCLERCLVDTAYAKPYFHVDSRSAGRKNLVASKACRGLRVPLPLNDLSQLIW